MESHGFDFIFSHSYKRNKAKILAFRAEYYRHFVRLSDFVYLSSVGFRDLLGTFCYSVMEWSEYCLTLSVEIFYIRKNKTGKCCRRCGVGSERYY